MSVGTCPDQSRESVLSDRLWRYGRESFHQTVERLKKVNSIIAELDEAIRAEAFAILRPYVEGKLSASQSEGDRGGPNAAEQTDTRNAEAFVRTQTIDKPAQAVAAIAAWWFSEYGSAPIKREDIEQIADEIGVTAPARSDNTLRAMKTDGKRVFRKAGRGTFVPTTPHGELFFKDEYGVTKGRKTRPAPDDS